jgi:hypothetical protein
MMIFMDPRKKKITRRKFLKASGKVAGAVASKAGKVRGVGELIMPQEASKPGIGHVYQEVIRNVKNEIVGYGEFSVLGSKTEQKVKKIPEFKQWEHRMMGTKPQIRKLEYLGEVDISDLRRDVYNIPEGPEYKFEGGQSHRQEISDFDEISMSLNEQVQYEDQSDWEFADEAHMDEIGPRESAPKHPFDNDNYGQKIKRLAGTAQRLSGKLENFHRLQDIAKKQIKSRSQMLLEHQNQQKEIKSQKKPSQVKQKVTQAIDLAKESPKTSSIISGASRFSGIFAGLELADMNPFSPPKLGAPGIAEWKLQEEKRKKKLVTQ